MYELLTGSIELSVIPQDLLHDLTRDGDQPHGDAPAGWSAACVLLRMLPLAESCEQGFSMSILRALAANPQIAASMPKYEPAPSSAKGYASLLSSDNPAAKLLDAAHEALLANGSELRWPSGGLMRDGPPAPKPPLAQSRTIQLEPLSRYRGLVVPRATDNGCEERALQTTTSLPAAIDAKELHALADAPMAPLPLGDFLGPSSEGLGAAVARGIGAVTGIFSGRRSSAPSTDASTDELPEPTVGEVPFELLAHPQAASHVARELIARLATDVVFHAREVDGQPEPKLSFPLF